MDYRKGYGINKVDIQAYAKDLAMIWKQEQGNQKLVIGGYSLGFRLGYHMTLKMGQQVERMINIDGMLYKNAGEEAQINHAIIATEKLEAVNEVLQVLESKKHKDLQLEKWFVNDYFVNPLKVEAQHFIGKESPVLNFIPEFVSCKNNVIHIQGNHENILEIEENLLVIINMSLNFK